MLPDGIAVVGSDGKISGARTIAGGIDGAMKVAC
jgi:hypothetical protein